MSFTLAGLVLVGAAYGFCGTYVGSAGAELFNHGSEVVLVRQGTRTTLTLGNDVDGDLGAFALVIPVPQVLKRRDVELVSPDVIRRIDAYSSPRLVRYTCDDLVANPTAASAMSCGGGEERRMPGPADSVRVESRFEVGEYEIVVLSAEESSELLGWLRSNGYAVHGRTEELLQEYIEGGAYFLAAKVDLRDVQPGRTWLSPLQLTYESAFLSLPIRLGTAASPGTQDLALYTLTELEQGRLAIANYPEVQVEDECLWSDDGHFGAFYEAQFTKAHGSRGASWALEYSWSPQKCDPCVGEPLGREDLKALGWRGNPSAAHFTRLHMRYDADAVDQDLALYPTGMRDLHQIRYIRHAHELEDQFEVCGRGFTTDPGSCWGEEPVIARDARRSGAPWWLCVPALFVALRARRSS